MKQILVVYTQNEEKLFVQNSNILVKDKDGNTLEQRIGAKCLLILIIGHCSITSGLIALSKKFRFQILLLEHNLRLQTTIYNYTEGNTLLRRRQYQYTQLDIAHYLITLKISSQMHNLKKIRSKSEQVKKAISAMAETQKHFIADREKLKTVHDLMGVEGTISRLYFQTFFDDLGWQSRKPRVKHDIINLLMDIGYTYLFHFVEVLLHLYGFDVYVGVLHREFYQRKSLVCDLMEPFRYLVDHAIVKAYHLGQIKKEDFTFHKNQYSLPFSKSKPYTKIFLEVILGEKEKMFLFIQQYYRCFVSEKTTAEFPIIDF